MMSSPVTAPVRFANSPRPEPRPHPADDHAPEPDWETRHALFVRNVESTPENRHREALRRRSVFDAMGIWAQGLLPPAIAEGAVTPETAGPQTPETSPG